MTAPAATARRSLSAFALGVACALTTSGCIYDAPLPLSASLVNERWAPVTLTFDGSSTEPQEFPAREGADIRYDGRFVEEDTCVEIGATVTDTATGEVLGTVDPPICGDTRIYVREDGTVE